MQGLGKPCVRPRVLVSIENVGIFAGSFKTASQRYQQLCRSLTSLFDESRHSNSRGKFQTVKVCTCLSQHRGPSYGGCPTAKWQTETAELRGLSGLELGRRTAGTGRGKVSPRSGEDPGLKVKLVKIAKRAGGDEFFGKIAEEYKTKQIREGTFRLSALDAARFGQLFLNGGRRGDKQVIPASWVNESTTPYSWAKRIRQGYGYMWWMLPADTWGPNAFYASGYGGQIIAVVSAKRLVVVQTVDLKQNPRGIRTSAFIDLLKDIASALP